LADKPQIAAFSAVAPTQAGRSELARRLTTNHAAAIVVGTVIGSGIFLVPTEMMQAVGSASLVFAAWIVGGLLSLCGALTYAELGAMKPQAGGEYIYIRDAYGSLAGFLYGWTYFTIAIPGTLATVAVGIVRILGAFAPLAFLGDPVVTRPFAVSYGQLLAIAAIVLIAVINWIGVERAGEFQLFFTVLKIVIILAIVLAGFSYHGGTWHNFSATHTNTMGGVAGFMAALLAALWAYDGWNLVTTVSGEIRDPQRSLRIALMFGVATVAVLYIAMNAALQFVMPASAIAGSPQPASAAMGIVLGRWGAGIVSAGMAISMLVCLNGNMMTGARIPFAMSRDRCFFPALARVHPRFRTPSTAIAVQAALAVVLALCAQSFQQLFSLTLFAEYIFYMAATTSVFIFRVKEPNAVRPYRTWGYPVVPVLFIAASAMLLYYSFRTNVKYSLMEIAMIAAGVPFYLYFAAKRPPGANCSPAAEQTLP
jgi:APA family basic amino acid/polyamine antiporter